MGKTHLLNSIGLELKKDHKIALSEMGRVLILKGNYKDGIQKLKEGHGSIIFDHTTNSMRINS